MTRVALPLTSSDWLMAMAARPTAPGFVFGRRMPYSELGIPLVTMGVGVDPVERQPGQLEWW